MIRTLQGRNANVLFTQPVWRHVQEYKKPSEQGGDGILSRIHQAYTGDLGTTIRNNLPMKSDDTFRPAFKGEMHAILRLSNGKNGVANYMGPGTNVLQRVKRKDPPRTPADAVAKAHDLRYTLARTNDDLRSADEKMVKKMKTIKDASRNIFVGKRTIQAKMLAEDLGIMKKGQFGDVGKHIEPSDRKILENELGTMEQEGYGLHLPGGALGNVVRKHAIATKGNHNQIVKRVMKHLLQGKGIHRQKARRLEALMHQGLRGNGPAWEKIKAFFKRIIPIAAKFKVRRSNASEYGRS
jgi:hypothetical protein